ncbi:MAG TPA: GNAT family N-acetyltransferase [Gammaproteobacteria bacterium]
MRLREFAELDLPEFAHYRAMPEVARYQSWENYTLEDARRLYTAQLGMAFGTAGSWHQVAIADKATDTLIGDCALHFLEGEELEIGFTLAPERQGRGLAKESVGLLLDHMRRSRVLAVTDAKNLAAQKLLLALRFQKQAERDVIFKGTDGKEFDFVRNSASS